MVKQSSSPRSSSLALDHDVVVFPTRPTTYVPPVFPAQRGGRTLRAAKAGVRTHAIRQVVVLEVAGRLSEVIEDLDRAIAPALAEGPRGVVCDLSNLSNLSDVSDVSDSSDASDVSDASLMSEGAEASAVEVLATAGRHVQDWPGVPVAVACPDLRVLEALRVHPLGRHLIVSTSMLTAVSAVLATPIPAVELLRLTPHPTSPRAARNFVARILHDWGLDSLIPWAALVVSELVTNSTIHAGTDIVLSLSWSQDALRLTVRDNSPDLPRQWYAESDLHGRGLSIVAGLSRADGFMPTSDGGKVVWAVLNAASASPGDQAALA